MPFGISSRAEICRNRQKVSTAKAVAFCSQIFIDYAAQRAEAQAAGHGFPTFTEWRNRTNRADAEHTASKAQQLFDDFGYVD